MEGDKNSAADIQTDNLKALISQTRKKHTLTFLNTHIHTHAEKHPQTVHTSSVGLCLSGALQDPHPTLTHPPTSSPEKAVGVRL